MENSNREKTAYTTRGGVAYECVNYITLGERESIMEAPMFASVNVKVVEGGRQEISPVPGNVMRQMQDKKYEMVVVSLQGSTDNILARIKALPVADGLEIKEKVAEIMGEKKAQPTPQQR